MRFSARLLGFLFAFFLLFFASKVSFAQTANVIPQNIPVQNLPQSVPNNLNTYTQNVLFSVMSAIGCQLAGIDPANPKQPCLAINPDTGKLGFLQNDRGLIGFTSNMITTLFNPPIHTNDYFRYLAGNFGITKGAHAQTGVGLTTIAPIANLWIIFRNIVYLFFVIIFVVIGVGIMLRLRIDPRTVMTIQNQIPKIVIGIILVTLSFPIAGFLIDMMWVVILVVKNTLEPLIISTNPLPYDYVTPFGLSNIFGGIFGIARDAGGFLGFSIFNAGFTTNEVNNLVGLAGQTQDCFFLDIGCWLGGLLGNLIGAILGFIIGIAVGLVAFLVITIALLYVLFKLWFELLKAYVSILIGIVFAPFWIVAGLIPGAGEKVGFGAWIRDMLGNLMAFPVAIGMFFLGAVFVTMFNKSDPTVFFIPPLIGPQSANFGPIIAFGILMMTPGAVKITRSVFKAPSTGVGIGEGAGGFAAAGALGGAIGSRLYGKNPQTGKREGPLVNVGQRATRVVAESGAGQRIGRLTSPIRNRVAPWFRRPETEAERRTARETAAETERIAREERERREDPDRM